MASCRNKPLSCRDRCNPLEDTRPTETSKLALTIENNLICYIQTTILMGWIDLSIVLTRIFEQGLVVFMFNPEYPNATHI